jgi:CDP-diacylglycerol--glycerol-3-phosphate 3-phosphatidyltransferase
MSLESSIKRLVARRLQSLGLTPNSLTLLGVLLSCLAAVVLVSEILPLLVSGLLFLVGCSADLFDGALARVDKGKHNLKVGAWLDTISDKVSEVAVLLALYLYLADLRAGFLISLAIASTLLASLTKAAAGEKGIELNWEEVQWFGHAGRVVILGLGLVISSFIPVEPSTALVITISVLLVFNILSLSERILKIVLLGGVARDEN